MPYYTGISGRKKGGYVTCGAHTSETLRTIVYHQYSPPYCGWAGRIVTVHYIISGGDQILNTAECIVLMRPPWRVDWDQTARKPKTVLEVNISFDTPPMREQGFDSEGKGLASLLFHS